MNFINMKLRRYFVAKYSFEFKLEVVKEYLNGNEGYLLLSKRFNIKHESTIKEWVNSYREFGEDGLTRKRENAVYTPQFKLDAINMYRGSNLSYRKVANLLGINNPSMICDWDKKFREGGFDNLNNQGKPSNNKNKEKKDV